MSPKRNGAQMSRILEAMRKAAPGDVDLSVRLASIDRGNLFPLPDAQATREFEQLATSLIHLCESATGQAVVFASTTSGEGASYVSYNCARMMALLLDRPIAWVDGNFESPTVKVQNQELNFRDLLVNPESLPPLANGAGLVVIGNGRRNVKRVDLLNGENYAQLVRRLEQSFYFTIIDGPPILSSVEVGHLAQPTMGVVLVVEGRRCKHEVIRHGLEKLRKQGITVLGTVLNKRVYELPSFVYRRF
jgi:Mrp family chromosome partitioning ATPase